ncbi:MAG: MotA/TolQ/ExbB proton channel family protein [Prevotella sp.]|nr:MotA/TolQ/ExbB proton channel family protein [Prevotella sp.]
MKSKKLKDMAAGLLLLCLLVASPTVMAQNTSAANAQKEAASTVADSMDVLAADSLAADSALVQAVDSVDTAGELAEGDQTGGIRQMLKKKFLEGNAGFMSLVALVLVLGLAFSIERIIYLTLSEIDARRFTDDLSTLIGEGKIEEAKALCRNTRGPVASICYQGLLRIDEPLESIERSITSYGSVQTSLLEKGTSWIRLFITMAPSLGFLGTVIGMVMAFEDIEMAGDLNASIVASGMKVALITTVFGIIVALILQLFYNYINTKIDRMVAQMEEAGITLLDAIGKMKASSGE